MKLTILVDNNTTIDKYYKGEPALSFLLELQGKKILFDTGYSDLFIKNAMQMGIELTNIDYLVLSHGHNDHIGGLEYLAKILTKKIPLIAHPDIFKHKKDIDNSNIGFKDFSAQNYFEINLTKNAAWILDNLVFLGEIPRKNSFEAKNPIGFCQKNNYFEPDFLLDDSALVYKEEDGISIITGCSHSGIINIINYAQDICKEKRVKSVIGGFHLMNCDKNLILKTVDNLKNINPQKIYPCHCTELIAKCELMKHFKTEEIGVGSVISFIE